jgi:hypothetical protein
MVQLASSMEGQLGGQLIGDSAARSHWEPKLFSFRWVPVFVARLYNMTDSPSGPFKFTWENVRSHYSDGDYITCPFHCQKRIYKLSRSCYYRDHYDNRCCPAALGCHDDDAPLPPPLLSLSRAQEADPDGFVGDDSLPAGIDGDDCPHAAMSIGQVSSVALNSLWRICSPKAGPVSCLKDNWLANKCAGLYRSGSNGHRPGTLLGEYF